MFEFLALCSFRCHQTWAGGGCQLGCYFLTSVAGERSAATGVPGVCSRGSSSENPAHTGLGWGPYAVGRGKRTQRRAWWAGVLRAHPFPCWVSAACLALSPGSLPFLPSRTPVPLPPCFPEAGVCCRHSVCSSSPSADFPPLEQGSFWPLCAQADGQ